MPLYHRRRAPTKAERMKGFLDTEFQNIERAIHGITSRTVTMDTSVLGSDDLILADPTSNPITVTFDAANTTKDLMVTVKQINSNANAVTLGGTFDGVLNPTLGAQNNALTVQSDGADYWIVGKVS